ncbi:hypothetical protein GCM10029964_014630 [Kibdelosporangium lantanae]
MLSLATVDDVQARADHTLTDQERTQAVALLADAVAIAYTHVPDIPTPPPPTAVGVVYRRTAGAGQPTGRHPQ